jgi:hypothetical protein
MVCDDLPLVETYRHIHRPKGMFFRLVPKVCFLLQRLLKFFRSQYVTKGLISIWAAFITRELDLHMKSQISKHHTKLVRNYSKKINMISTIIYLCVLICSQEGNWILLKVIDDYPSTLHECICSLKPCIGHHAPDHPFSSSFQDTIDMHLVIRIHMEMFLQYQIESCQ